jgi:hypothetical protein
MKKLAILSMTFLFALSVAYGQNKTLDKEKVKETKKELKSERVALRKLEGNVVSVKAKSNFNVDFNGATNVQWKRIDTYDQAEFTSKDGHKLKAYYDADGILVGSTEVKTFADIPAKGQKEIKEKYKDYTIEQVIFYDDNETNTTDMIMYGIQFDDADNYFVELSKGTNKIILQVNTEGTVFLFKKL